MNTEENYIRIDQLAKDGFVDKAFGELTDFLAKAPNHALANNLIGWIYETRLSDFETAMKYYGIAMESAPGNPAVYYNPAILLSTLERFDELDNLLRKAIKVPGVNKSTLHNEWGIMFELLGEYEEAVKSYRNAVRQSTDSKSVQGYMEAIDRCHEKQNMDR